MLGLEAMAKTLGGKFACRIARKTERFGDWRPKKRIAKSVQDQGEGAFSDVVGFVADRELGDEPANGIQNGVEGIAIAGEDHPCGKCSGTFLAEGIETLIDDHARVRLSGAGPFDCIGDTAVDRIGDGFRKLALKSGGGPEMVEQVRMGPSDLAGDSLQRHGLRALFNEELARRAKRGGAAFFRGEAGSSY